MKVKREIRYRFTIRTRYGIGTVGYNDATARQGYYMHGANAREARRKLYLQLKEQNGLRNNEGITSLEQDRNYQP